MTKQQCIDVAQLHANKQRTACIVWQTTLGYVWDRLDYVPKQTPDATIVYPQDVELIEANFPSLDGLVIVE